jgi:hypothetical protein
MRHHRSPRIFGSPPLHCPCCGEASRQSGCVLGFPCQCDNSIEKLCKRCLKCPLHCRCKARREGLAEILHIAEDAGLYD